MSTPSSLVYYKSSGDNKKPNAATYDHYHINHDIGNYHINHDIGNYNYFESDSDDERTSFLGVRRPADEEEDLDLMAEGGIRIRKNKHHDISLNSFGLDPATRAGAMGVPFGAVFAIGSFLCWFCRDYADLVKVIAVITICLDLVLLAVTWYPVLMNNNYPEGIVSSCGHYFLKGCLLGGVIGLVLFLCLFGTIMFHIVATTGESPLGLMESTTNITETPNSSSVLGLNEEQQAADNYYHLLDDEAKLKQLQAEGLFDIKTVVEKTT